MLLPPTSTSSRSSRFGRQRRHIRKLASVFRLLGVLCALVSVIFFVSSRVQEKKVAHNQVVVSLIFLAVSPTLLTLGFGLDWWKHRFYGRGRKLGILRAKQHLTMPRTKPIPPVIGTDRP